MFLFPLTEGIDERVLSENVEYSTEALHVKYDVGDNILS